MVNPGPSMRQLRLQESKKKNRSNKRSHPADIREGVATAVMLVKEVSSCTFIQPTSIECLELHSRIHFFLCIYLKTTVTCVLIVKVNFIFRSLLNYCVNFYF